MPVLTFKGKSAVENHHHTVPHHVLETDAKRSVLSKGDAPSLSGNLIIEGDNLLALKALLPTHAGRIKCIYIDPPYNTGNEGWVYNDNLTQPQFKEWLGAVVGKEGEDASRHDKWCCMMWPRLNLLRDLLTDDGVIFVSIDDNEVHNLRSMMDEVFGEDRRLGCFVWKSRQNIDNRNITGASIDHEYVLCYGRRIRGAHRNRSQYANPDNDPRGDWASGNMVGLATKGQRPNLHYDLMNQKTGINYGRPEKGWRYDPSTMQRLIAENRIIWPESPDGRPRRKVFLGELRTEFTGFSSIIAADVFTRNGSLEIRRIFGDEPFAFPKPSRLIEILIDQATGDDSIVLDSFAGSGTTGHATLNLNATDGGNRQFILIQQAHDSKEDEKRNLNICNSVTAERLRRVMEGYTKRANGDGDTMEKVEGLGGSFTYARLGPPLLGENKTWGEKPPAWNDLARYIYFTDTSQPLDVKEVNEKTGRLGGHAGVSYYLLYTPEPKQSRALDADVVKQLAADKAKRKVVYCEKLWVHRDDLAKARDEGNHIRPMFLPFQVK